MGELRCVSIARMSISTELRDRVARDPSIVLAGGDLQELDAKFNEIDKDGDGEITRVELRRSLGGGGQAAPFVTESRVNAFLRDMDLDGDGCLTFEELASATAVRRLEGLVVRIEHEVALLDPNSDASDASISGGILTPLLEALGLYDASACATAIASLECGPDDRVDREQLALAYFAGARGEE